MKIKRRITQHERPNGQIILECYDNSTEEGRKQTLNEALEKLYEFEEMLESGELQFVEPRLIPKYKVGNTVWCIGNKSFGWSGGAVPYVREAQAQTIKKVYVNKTCVSYALKGRRTVMREQYLYSTQEECEEAMKSARMKLEKGE